MGVKTGGGLCVLGVEYTPISSPFLLESARAEYETVGDEDVVLDVYDMHMMQDRLGMIRQNEGCCRVHETQWGLEDLLNSSLLSCKMPGMWCVDVGDTGACSFACS